MYKMLQTYCGTRFCMLALFLLPSRSFPPPVFDHLQYAKTYTKQSSHVQKHTPKLGSQCGKTWNKNKEHASFPWSHAWVWEWGCMKSCTPVLSKLHLTEYCMECSCLAHCMWNDHNLQTAIYLDLNNMFLTIYLLSFSLFTAAHTQED